MTPNPNADSKDPMPKKRLGPSNKLLYLVIVPCAILLYHFLHRAPELASGFLGNSSIKLVREGYLNGHPETTIGRAFGAALANGRWTSFETQSGIEVVQFEGTYLLGNVYPDPAVLGTTEESNACSAKFPASPPPPPQLTPEQVAATTKASADLAALRQIRDQIAAEPLPPRPAGSDPRDNPNAPMYDRDGKPSANQTLLKEFAKWESAKTAHEGKLGDVERKIGWAEEALKQAEQAQPQAVTIPDPARDAAIENCMKNTPVPVTIQFQMNQDGEHFKLSAINSAHLATVDYGSGITILTFLPITSASL